MAVTAPILCRVTLPDVDGIAADAVTNGFAFASADFTAAENAIVDFYNGANTTLPISSYIGGNRSRVALSSMIQVYDLAGFLHGEPHGSPVDTFFFTLGAPTTADEPDQLAAVLSYHADVSALPEHGGTAVRPTEEESQDQGAPATYIAKTRPRASLRGRIYIGPLCVACAATSGSLTATFKVDLGQAAHRLRVAVAGSWGVWSRTYGTVTPIMGGWVDDDFGTIRRRRDRTVTRTSWV